MSNIVKADTQIEFMPDIRSMEAMGNHLLKSGLWPQVKGLPQMIAIIEKGRELGLPPVASLDTMCIIRGKVTMEAKAMLAVARSKASVTWKVDELTNDKCVMTFIRPGSPDIQVEFTADEAKTAGLLGKDSWRLYRQDMLFARCASRGIRRIAPDAVLGLYSTEEMRDVEHIDKATPKELDEIIPEEISKLSEEETEPTVPQEGEQGASVSDDDNLDDVPLPLTEETEERKVDPDLTEDDEINSYIVTIKDIVESAGIDLKDFKDWLVIKGKELNRTFVGKMGKALRFHEGAKEDIEYLLQNIGKAIEMYRQYKGE